MVPQEKKVPEAVAEPVEEEPVVGDFVDIDIPDRLQDDCLVRFLRIRFDEQDAYLAGLKKIRDNPSEQPAVKKKMEIELHRIKKEMERIKTLRQSFASSLENDFVMDRFNWYRAYWRLQAQNKSADNLKDLDLQHSRVSKMGLDPEDYSRRLKWERQILQKVGEWTKHPILSLYTQPPKDPEEEKREEEEEEKKKAAARKKRESLRGKLGALFEQKEIESEDKPLNNPRKRRSEPPKVKRPRPLDSYGLTVSEITLRRSDKACASSFMSYEMQKHSLNDGLFKKENNPLTKKCEKNAIRYFHIPANNMHWIEVLSLLHHHLDSIDVLLGSNSTLL
jgi:hypothetical protein